MSGARSAPNGASAWSAAGSRTAPLRSVVRRHPGWIGAGALVLLLATVLISAASTKSDAGSDLSGSLSRTGDLFARMSWLAVAAIVGLAALHYIAAAVAARAAAGVRMPFGETVLAQLSASTANRLTPAGLGGTVVLARYMMRRGGLLLPAAVSAVSALTVLGAIADLMLITGLVFCGSLVGLGGGPGEVSALLAHLRGLVGSVRSPWLWLVVLGVGSALAFAAVRSRRDSSDSGSFSFGPVRDLARRPGSLVVLMLASAGTTLILALAFALTTYVMPGPRPVASVGALVIGFMLGSAASNALPIPGGLGAAETALIGVLVASRVPAGQAFEEVMIFRVITFWMPAVIGIPVARLLRRRQAI